MIENSATTINTTNSNTTEIVLFNNPNFGQVRTLMIDGEPWFVGKDIASKLGYTDTFGALKNTWMVMISKTAKTTVLKLPVV